MNDNRLKKSITEKACRTDVPSPSSGASSSLQLGPEPSISSSSAAYWTLASSFCEAFPLRRAFRSFSWVKTRTHLNKISPGDSHISKKTRDVTLAPCGRKTFKNMYTVFSQHYIKQVWLANVLFPYRFHFMLLQNLIQFLPLLVVEVKVLALWHCFWSHHLGDGGPIPTILEKACE